MADASSPRLLPTFRARWTALPEERRRSLAEVVGVEDEAFSLPFASRQFPGPTRRERDVRPDDEAPAARRPIPIERFRRISLPTAEEAVERSLTALDSAGLGLDSWAPVEAGGPPEVTTSQLEIALAGKDGPERETIPVDLHVELPARLAGLPLVGPGAKVKFVWGDGGALHYLWLEMPRLEELGTTTVMSPAQAIRRCAKSLGCSPRDLEAEAELVYFVASAAEEERILVPSYRITGRFRSHDKSVGWVEMQASYLSADAGSAPLTLNIQVSPVDGRLQGRAEASGGTPPYRYSWHASTLPGGAEGPEVEIDPPSSLDGEREHVVAIARDDSDAYASARALVDAEPLNAPADPLTRVGSEWAGNSASVSSVGDAIGSNALDFIAAMRAAGWSVVFNRGDQLAEERHFMDPGSRPDGEDAVFADNATLVLFSGHGDEAGFSFVNQEQLGLLGFNQNPRWGNGSLRWLAVNACTLLKLESGLGDWASRWGPAFAGLRLLLGFTNFAGNLPGTGASFAASAVQGQTLMSAWMTTSIAIQESDVHWAVMGVIDEQGIDYWNDALGSTDPSVAAPHETTPSFRGYWLYHGPS